MSVSYQEFRPNSIFTASFVQSLTAVLLFVALLNYQRELVLTCILVLLIMAGARLWSRFSLMGVQPHTRINRTKLFPGERLNVNMRVENKKWLPIKLHVNLPIDDSLPVAMIKTDSEDECGLLGYQRADFMWALAVQRRGVFDLEPARITAGDLLGFFLRSDKGNRAFIEIVVYPKIIPLKQLPFPRKDFFGVPGAKSPVQDPIYILGTRDYQHWQPARYIHWKASARYNRLQEKIFEPSSQAKILLLIDTASFDKANACDDFERVLETVASVALQCDQDGYALGLLTNGVVKTGNTFLPISRGTQRLSAILEILARLQMKANMPLKQELQKGHKLHWGASAVYFSYEEDQDMRVVAQYLEAHQIPMVSMVCRPSSSGTSNSASCTSVITLDEIRADTVTS